MERSGLRVLTAPLRWSGVTGARANGDFAPALSVARIYDAENVCLHCGLCAERCPTGAWDMQRFLYSVTKAG